MKNLRFLVAPVSLLIVVFTFFAGSFWLWSGVLIVTLLPRLLDFLIGDEKATPIVGPEWLMAMTQFAVLALLTILTLLLLYYVSGDRMIWLEMAFNWTGADLAAAQSGTNIFDLIGGVLTLALYIGSTGVIVGHEFFHRADRALYRLLGVWLLAPTGYTAFALEHVKGHHVDVAIPGDPESALRGKGFWRFAVENFMATNRNAMVREQNRLRRKGLPWFSFGNRFLQGFAMTGAIVILFVLAAGIAGLAAFVVISFFGIICITLFAYIAHYGLVRVPGTPIEARHSWNAYRFWSTSFMFNLTRHASHHLHGNRPFWKLEVEPAGPVFPYGATVMAGIALVPPLWRNVMAGPLAEWDAQMATPDELRLLKQVDITRNACADTVDLQSFSVK